jgi:hypothetical protein
MWGGEHYGTGSDRSDNGTLRKSDTDARFGGDEFVLIFPDMEVIEDAIQVVQKIIDRFHKPFLFSLLCAAVNCCNYGLNRFIILVYIGGADCIRLAAVIRIGYIVSVVPVIHSFGRYDHLTFLGVDLKRFIDIRKFHSGFLAVEPGLWFVLRVKFFHNVSFSINLSVRCSWLCGHFKPDCFTESYDVYWIKILALPRLISIQALRPPPTTILSV